MHTIQVDDGVLKALEAQVSGFGQTPNDVLRRLLDLDGGTTAAPSHAAVKDPVLKLLESPSFLALSEAEERYLAILGVLYSNHRTHFSRLETYGKGKRPYFARSTEAIKAAAPYAGAKAVPNSPYFALTTLDNASKRKVLQKALTMFGYRASTTSKATATIPSRTRSGSGDAS